MVIDMLSMSRQLKHQTEAWGKLSYKIGDYTELNLHQLSDQPEGKALHAIVDPWSYRQRITQPKLIVLGTNDHYWPLDALNLYWNDLVGEKRVLYVPNNRHSIKDLGRLLATLSAFHHAVRRGRPLPKIAADFETVADDGAIKLLVRTDAKPKKVVVWRATSQTRDFRQSQWTSKPIEASKGQYSFKTSLPASGYESLFAEATFDQGDGEFYLSTTLRILDSNGVLRSKYERNSP